MPQSNFKFTTIYGMMEIEEATNALVKLAKNIQESHTNASSTRSRDELELIFDIRKKGIMALLNLIEDYIEQVPENID